ncbi:hypothetical protein OV203_09620 [Nannocystis sp. ILAH1]|uniref:hypothetical protein n=1 Tax=Nannocystis sp. ILAH1 TaxID=2996789 RepID=UPI0022703DCC|nr:hypothetical protein [Nannocystis sp. ILAH1]MCY0987380.1 hypothetical protein [Nannocystis sp. ILAH1]
MSSAMLALWLMQAPPWPSLPATTPPREWNLAGRFTLKHEKHLRWQAVVDPTHPYKGLYSDSRPTWLLELRPTQRRFRDVALVVESLPAFGSGVGIVRPRLTFRAPGTQIHLGLGVQLRAFRSSGR